MEKLKSTILQKINDHIVLHKDDCPLRYAPEWAAELISKKVKDITINFYCERLNINRNSRIYDNGELKTIDELFNQFINTYEL
mgnify:CR=1 FL=1